MINYKICNKLKDLLQTIAVVTMFICVSSAVGDNVNTLSINNLIKRLATTERALVNLKIDSEMWQEEMEQSTKVWKRKPVHTISTAWYNGMPGSKARIDMHKNLSPWKNGKADFSENCYSIGFDGKFGRVAKHYSIVTDEKIAESSGEILPNRPKRLEVVGESTGTIFSIFFWKNDRSLSQLLKEIVDSGIKLIVADELSQGVKCIKITTGNQKWGSQTWWLDKSRDLALIGYEIVNVDKNGQPLVVISDRVTQLIEASPGIWYPTKAVRTKFIRKAGGNTVRSHFKASQVVANDPSFDDSIFTIDFPPGYRIHDKVADVRYVRGPTPKQLQKMLDTLIGDLDNIRLQDESLTGKIVSTSAASISSGNENIQNQEEENANPLIASSDITDIGAHSIHSKRNATRWMFLGAIGSVFLIAIVLSTMRFKHGNSKTAILFLLLLMYPLSNISIGNKLSRNKTGLSQKQIAMPAYHFNCGVNVGYIVLRLFDISISVSEVTDKLNVGEVFEKSVSLLDLKTLFWKNGLTVKGFRTSDPNEMLNFLKGKELLVVHTSRRLLGQGFGHYLIFAGSEEHPLVIDPPNIVRRLKQKDFVKQNFTGNFLVVSKRTMLLSHKEPRISIQNSSIDLGHIPLTATEVRGEIWFENIGLEELKIIRVQGPCSCLLDWSGDTVLLPGQSGKIQVIFDKNKLPDGFMTRVVKLLTNDPKDEVIKVNFNFTVQKVPHREDIRLLPQIVNYGRISRLKIASDDVLIKVVIPYTDQKLAKNSHVEAEASTYLLETTKTSDSQIHQVASDAWNRVITYKISWRQAPKAGILKEEIRFIIDNGKGSRNVAKVPLRADVLPE